MNNFFVVAFISDITLRKQAEQALVERNEALDAFAHTLAHDIKNSVAVVTGFGALLSQTIDDLSREEILEYVENISKTGEKINHIIEGLLFFSTVSREGVTSVPVDMTPVVESAIERVKKLADEHHAVILKPESFPFAMGYASWIEEIWFNYISNAIKYGGNPPKVELGATERNDGFITYWVKDSGPGLRPEQQLTIFEAYESRKEKSKKGYGLGLSIVKRIAEKLHGSVGVESRPEGGSVFTFTLPQAQKDPIT